MIVSNSATLDHSLFQKHIGYCKLIIQCKLEIIMQKKCEGVVRNECKLFGSKKRRGNNQIF